MAKIELQEKTSYRKSDFDPVELKDGTVVKMSYVIDGEKKTLTGEAVKDNVKVAMLRVNPDGNRLFMQVDPLNSVPGEAAVEIIETFVAGINHLLTI